MGPEATLWHRTPRVSLDDAKVGHGTFVYHPVLQFHRAVKACGQSLRRACVFVPHFASCAHLHYFRWHLHDKKEVLLAHCYQITPTEDYPYDKVLFESRKFTPPVLHPILSATATAQRKRRQIINLLTSSSAAGAQGSSKRV